MSTYRAACLLLVALILPLAACTPAGDVSTITLPDIAGLWDSSVRLGTRTDVIYTRISHNGDIVEYDYDGDAVDQGLHCYVIETGAIKRMSDNRFLVSDDMHEGNWFEIRLTMLDKGHIMKVDFIDPKDPATIRQSQIWVREADTSILDNEPACQ